MIWFFPCIIFISSVSVSFSIFSLSFNLYPNFPSFSVCIFFTSSSILILIPSHISFYPSTLLLFSFSIASIAHSLISFIFYPVSILLKNFSSLSIFIILYKYSTVSYTLMISSYPVSSLHLFISLISSSRLKIFSLIFLSFFSAYYYISVSLFLSSSPYSLTVSTT